jgi:NAD(P)-dependent dehydrogenase (short-subunit alcohol dehydrogenase family)
VPSVFITGASTGIGRDAALRMSRRGWVTFGGVRADADAESLISASDGLITPVRCDVTDVEEIAAAADQVLSATGGSLTGLVNNAGIARPGPLEILPIEDLRVQLDVNVVGQLAVTQAFVDALRHEGGRIVNIGSVSGMYGAPGIGAYAMSKFALEAFTDVLRRELAPWKISVSIIQPGSIETPIWDKTIAAAWPLLESLDEGQRARYEQLIEPLARGATAPKRTPVSAVSDAVEHALVDRRPRTRYAVGPSARWITILRRLLPDRGLDQLARIRRGRRR